MGYCAQSMSHSSLHIVWVKFNIFWYLTGLLPVLLHTSFSKTVTLSCVKYETLCCWLKSVANKKSNSANRSNVKNCAKCENFRRAYDMVLHFKTKTTCKRNMFAHVLKLLQHKRECRLQAVKRSCAVKPHQTTSTHPLERLHIPWVSTLSGWLSNVFWLSKGDDDTWIGQSIKLPGSCSCPLICANRTLQCAEL